MARNLSIMLRTLNASRINAAARITAHSRVEVWIGDPKNGLRDLAFFSLERLGDAAEWLAASALKHYPQSDFAKVWKVVGDAAAAAAVGQESALKKSGP
jgi:hypothetical protein